MSVELSTLNDATTAGELVHCVAKFDNSNSSAELKSLSAQLVRRVRLRDGGGLHFSRSLGYDSFSKADIISSAEVPGV